MIILTLRTDKPEAEVGLYDDNQQINYEVWLAHRTLAETIHSKIEELLNKSSNPLDSIQGIVAYKGPGSFTGLRIGLSVANALAYSLDVPIVSASSDDWIKDGVSDLLHGKNEKQALPEYGGEAHTTTPKK